MKTVLVEKYGVDQDNPENRVVTEMWDFLQTQVRDIRTSVCIHIQSDSDHLVRSLHLVQRSTYENQMIRFRKK